LRLRRLLDDESGQILRRVILYGVVFALIILIIVEFGPLLWDRFSVSQMSDDMANAAANSYNLSHDQVQAVTDVTTKLKLSGLSDEEVQQCQVFFLPSDAPTKLSVKVTVVEYANSYILLKIGFFKKLAKITSTHEVGLSGR
jgi:Flp pilus assembly protein TadG